ncbi:MAG: hypothetical protein Q4D25_01470 [Bacteroidales bacterium]|nr:hypothetical protein [Bacteroidales bacterium]
MIWFILAIIFAILAFYFHNSADKMENSTKSNPQPSYAAPKSKTYWESFKESNPTKAKEIETLWGLDFSTLSDRDAREKKETLERLSKGMNCSISQIKEKYLKEIERYPARLIPQMIESTSRERSKEMETFHIGEGNTASALMVKWLKERHKELGAPDANISASASDKEIEIAKSYFPYTKIEDLQERIKSLREMSELFKCPIEGLEKLYKDDVMSKYDGTYENFHYLPEAYKYMANQAYEVAPRVALKPENTSYGIMCDWLSDIMESERMKFIDNKEVKCPYCHSSDIKLGIFKNEFECNSCGKRFSGL